MRVKGESSARPLLRLIPYIRHKGLFLEENVTLQVVISMISIAAINRENEQYKVEMATSETK